MQSIRRHHTSDSEVLGWDQQTAMGCTEDSTDSRKDPKLQTYFFVQVLSPLSPLTSCTDDYKTSLVLSSELILLCNSMCLKILKLLLQ